MTNAKTLRTDSVDFFPNPQAIWKRLPAIHPRLTDYMGCFIYNGLQVIATVEQRDGMTWLHVSFSRQNRIPDYKDIQMIKRDFFGGDKKAIMVFPEEQYYVNTHPYCLHLWYSPDNPLPEFSFDVDGTRQI